MPERERLHCLREYDDSHMGSTQDGKLTCLFYEPYSGAWRSTPDAHLDSLFFWSRSLLSPSLMDLIFPGYQSRHVYQTFKNHKLLGSQFVQSNFQKSQTYWITICSIKLTKITNFLDHNLFNQTYKNQKLLGSQFVQSNFQKSQTSWITMESCSIDLINPTILDYAQQTFQNHKLFGPRFDNDNHIWSNWSYCPSLWLIMIYIKLSKITNFLNHNLIIIIMTNLLFHRFVLLTH
jgi:hypothetical protein